MRDFLWHNYARCVEVGAELTELHMHSGPRESDVVDMQWLAEKDSSVRPRKPFCGAEACTVEREKTYRHSDSYTDMKQRPLPLETGKRGSPWGTGTWDSMKSKDRQDKQGTQ